MTALKTLKTSLRILEKHLSTIKGKYRMTTIHRIIGSTLITYTTVGKKLPSTSELMKSLEPVDQVLPSTSKTAVKSKKIDFTRGYQTPQAAPKIDPMRSSDWEDGNRSDGWRGRNTKYKDRRLCAQGSGLTRAMNVSF